MSIFFIITKVIKNISIGAFNTTLLPRVVHYLQIYESPSILRSNAPSPSSRVAVSLLPRPPSSRVAVPPPPPPPSRVAESSPPLSAPHPPPSPPTVLAGSCAASTPLSSRVAVPLHPRPRPPVLAGYCAPPPSPSPVLAGCCAPFSLVSPVLAGSRVLPSTLCPTSSSLTRPRPRG